MQSTRKSFSILVIMFAAAFVVAPAQAAPNAADSAFVSNLFLNRLLTESDDANNCDADKAQMLAQREALMRSPEWRQVVATEEFRAFIADIIQLETLCSRADPLAAPFKALCGTLRGRFQVDFGVLQSLQAFGIAAQTAEFQTLVAAQAVAQQHGCIDYLAPDSER